MFNRKKHLRARHLSVATTNRREFLTLEGGASLPEELTGRASSTSEPITALFADDSAEHLEDGFRGGSGDDVGSDLLKGEEGEPSNDQS